MTCFPVLLREERGLRVEEWREDPRTNLSKGYKVPFDNSRAILAAFHSRLASYDPSYVCQHSLGRRGSLRKTVQTRYQQGHNQKFNSG